jgi:phosphoribosyl 1,2-cyclic phosphodiesterase
MKVTLWGTRGSLPSPGPDTARYGGNTSCVAVQGREDTLLVLDAGTGIWRLGQALPTSLRRVDVLLTHLHMDHIQGLAFFAPLRSPQVEAHIWGPASTTRSLRSRLTQYLSPPLFPVYLREMQAGLHLHEVPSEPIEIGEFCVAASLVCHPDPTVGYRVEAGGAALTYLPDHEPALGARHFPIRADWTSGYKLAAGSDLLIHDSQYTDEEYAERTGFGHSALRHTLAFAALAQVKHLVPFHHDPGHTDDDLDRWYGKALAATQPAFRVTPGQEGQTFDLTTH